MDVKTVPADTIFRVFTACPGDVRTLILDVRSYKEFSKKHVIGAYCIRLSANGKVLLVSGGRVPGCIPHYLAGLSWQEYLNRRPINTLEVIFIHCQLPRGLLSFHLFTVTRCLRYRLYTGVWMGGNHLA